MEKEKHLRVPRKIMQEKDNVIYILNTGMFRLFTSIDIIGKTYRLLKKKKKKVVTNFQNLSRRK